jgi:hypothetical protein
MEDISFYQVRALTCRWAAEFEEWAVQHVQTVLRDSTIERINQGKLVLLDKYYEWRSSTPPNHKAQNGKRGKHRCLLDVMDDIYGVLNRTSRRISPPVLTRPKRQKEITKPPELYSILGDIDAESNP